jgi:AcrR family transcriptional regulator
MGRHRVHDEATVEALLAAAEDVVDAEGAAGLTVREVADRVGVSTRAVYSTLGSKDGLLQELGARAFDTLASMVDALPRTDDPARDLVSAGVDGFRAFALAHPGLFRIGIQLTDTPPTARPHIRAAADRALATLTERLERLQSAGLLDGRPLLVAASQFHAACEGLAAAELRGGLAPPADPAEVWAGGLSALVRGWRPASCLSPAPSA